MLHKKQMFPSESVVWVNKRYTPNDLRGTAPVPRVKFINPPILPDISRVWKRPVNPPIKFYSRHQEEQNTCKSSPSTRCEEWSTLRQMLPSRGRSERVLPPRWGSDYEKTPKIVSKKETRFPIINSPMTKYVDEMHLTNRLFKLH